MSEWILVVWLTTAGILGEGPYPAQVWDYAGYEGCEEARADWERLTDRDYPVMVARAVCINQIDAWTRAQGVDVPAERVRELTEQVQSLQRTLLGLREEAAAVGAGARAALEGGATRTDGGAVGALRGTPWTDTAVARREPASRWILMVETRGGPARVDEFTEREECLSRGEDWTGAGPEQLSGRTYQCLEGASH